MYEEYYQQDPFTGEKYPQSIYHNNPDLKVVGDPTIRRVDAGPKVTGQAKFANDIILPQMLYLKFKRCQYSHAKVRSIDTSKAKALPGVVMVLTHDDVPELMARPPYNYVLMNECFHEGTEVAAVAADEEDIAEEALALIDVEYEVLPFVLYSKEALEPGAPILWGETNEVGSPVIINRGDFDAAYAAADIKVEGELDSLSKPWSGSRDVAPLENESCTMSWENGRMTIWVATQNPHREVGTIAAQLGLSRATVVQLPTYMGVGFGSKGSKGGSKILAAWISRETNRPVKCYIDSHGEFSTSRSQQTSQNHHFKAGVQSDGTLTAFKDINIQNSGSWGGRGANSAQSCYQSLYTVPNIYLEARDVATNTQGTGVPRCVHHPQASTLVNMFMDRVAEAVNMDPADFLVKNVFKGSGPGAHQDEPEWDIGSNPMPDMLEKLIAESGWKTKWKGWKTPVAVNGTKRTGIGIAMGQCYHGWLANPESAHIKANLDGTFTLSVGSHDTGGGFRTAGAIQAAEELGVPFEKVMTGRYDTDAVAESCGTGGSRVTRGSGTAVILAARDVKYQLFELAIAAGLIEADKAEDLETADGYIYLKADPGTKVEISKVCAKQNSVHVPSTLGGPIIGRGSYATKRPIREHMQWNSAVAEVEVDTETGEVEVLDIWVEHDIGRTIFYQGSVNQLYGGTIMSMGRGLYEGVVKDEATGFGLNSNYLDYKLPTHADIPNIHPGFYENIDPYGPFGAKGIGEPLCHGPAPAILNAIYNAVGARLNGTMATPEKILAAMGKA